MSFVLTSNSGRADLGGSGPTFANWTIAAWFKTTSATSRKGIMCCSGALTSTFEMLMNLRNSDGYEMGTWRNSGTTADVVNDINLVSANDWQLFIYRFDGTTHKVRRNAGTDKTGSGSGSWTTPYARYITFGRWTPDDGTNYISNNAKIAHMALWDAALTDQQCADLFNGGTAGAGKNPTAVAASNLKAYWYDSKTSYTGSYAISDLEGSITVDTGDNPTVDAPASGGGITLTQVERGRGVLRGLGRGL